MAKKITVRLDVGSIDTAIRELKEVKRHRDEKIAELMKALAEAGLEATGYGSMVWVEETDNGCKIIAHDEQIAFIEFGAGDAATYMNTVDGVDIYPGSWSGSDLGTGEYARYRSWHYQGEKFTEIQPQRGMLKAEETIIARVREIAERVFADG